MTTAEAKLWIRCWHRISRARRGPWLPRRRDCLPGGNCVVTRNREEIRAVSSSPRRSQTPGGTRLRLCPGFWVLSLSPVPEVLQEASHEMFGAAVVWEALRQLPRCPWASPRHGSARHRDLGSLCELGVSLGQQNDPKAGTGSAPLLLGARGVSGVSLGVSLGFPGAQAAPAPSNSRGSPLAWPSAPGWHWPHTLGSCPPPESCLASSSLLLLLYPAGSPRARASWVPALSCHTGTNPRRWLSSLLPSRFPSP